MFIRKWDSTCPRVWDQWEANGKKWVIQDLPPEDDNKALQILWEHLCSDEVLCGHSDLMHDEESMRSIGEFWVACLSQRLSLACYVEENGERTLVALNVCVADTPNERMPAVPIEGEAWKNVFGALDYVELTCDAYKYLEIELVLHALGLVVVREYRGAKLGAKLLNAREPLSKSQGIRGTATVFTGPASQKLAASCGFITIGQASLKELSDAGMNYPKNPNAFVKLMVKKYNH